MTHNSKTNTKMTRTARLTAGAARCTMMMVVLMLAGNAAAEQQGVAGGQVRVENKQFRKVGDKVKVAMDICLDDLKLKSNRGLMLVPMMVNGEDTLRMQAVEVLGRKRYIYWQRNGATMTENPLVVERRHNGEQQTVAYKTEVSYEEWMTNSSLVLAEDNCGCTQSLLGNALTSDGGEALLGPWKCAYAYVEPDPEPVKERHESGVARLNFHLDKYDIVPSLGNNRAELDSIRRTIDKVRDDADVTITSIELHGYASPDGNYYHNADLARNRIRALYLYLRDMYNLPDGLYRNNTTPEDWEGAIVQARKSDLIKKDEVLRIMESEMHPDQKEAQLGLKTPADYRFLVDNVFPGLRRTEYTVNYDVRNFNLEEARKLINTRPQKLSLKEMYVVANSYERGSEEYKHAYDVAVAMFPNDETANVNAAYVALDGGDLGRAERYLKRAGNTPQAENARGALEVLRGNFDKARPHFQKAADAGLQEAVENLRELKRRLQ